MSTCAYIGCRLSRREGKIYCDAHWRQWDELTTLGIEKKLIATYIMNSRERDYSNMCLGCLTDLYDELVHKRHVSTSHPIIIEILGQMEERTRHAES